tara:strand:- start:426 stop:1583 length:1158 start_codon:yes stop_codon:yes gene_type:complete
MKVLFVLRRIGPYHHSRFTAAVNAGIDLIVVETRPNSKEYPWEFNSLSRYKKISFPASFTTESDLKNKELDNLFQQILNKYKPNVAVSAGWSDRSYMRLLISCYKRKIPITVVSDSRDCDKSRPRVKELIKRILIRGYHSSLVAGKESKEYLIKLGFSSSAIFQPWDVVDNVFFKEAFTGKEINLPPHFLCVGRFLERKNHVTILNSYAKYQSNNGKFGLKLIGSGPLELRIRDLIKKLPNPKSVTIEPFQQLKELSISYKKAYAFILASTQDTWGLVINEAMASGLPCIVSNSCGCATDLIKNKVSGFTFNPLDSDRLTEIMHLIENQSSSDRNAMINEAKKKLENFTPEAFAIGLQNSVNFSINKPSFSKSAFLTAELLSRCF